MGILETIISELLKYGIEISFGQAGFLLEKNFLADKEMEYIDSEAIDVLYNDVVCWLIKDLYIESKWGNRHWGWPASTIYSNEDRRKFFQLFEDGAKKEGVYLNNRWELWKNKVLES